MLGNHPAIDAESDYLHEDLFNMTHLALNYSGFVNGVVKKQQEVTSHMFANYKIDAIANGINVNRWTCPSLKGLFDKYIPDWKEDNFSLRYAYSIPLNEIWQAHQVAKKELLHLVNRITNKGLDIDVFTIGFARREATYKRAELIFQNVDLLKQIAARFGGMQIIFAGKAHPEDQKGEAIIQQIHA